jgi:hypothetical protein
VLEVPVALFENATFGARLVLEIPTCNGLRHAGGLVSELVGRTFGAYPAYTLVTCVPDVRAWSYWSGGPLEHTRIASHHENPDLSMCVCMPHEWLRCVHPLLEYVDFCTLWVARALHELVLGWYPGRQHFGERARAMRDHRLEFCGCGSDQRYQDCCRNSDLALSHFERWRRYREARSLYLSILRAQGRESGPPQFGVMIP